VPTVLPFQSLKWLAIKHKYGLPHNLNSVKHGNSSANG